jgi:hypothetical protein
VRWRLVVFQGEALMLYWYISTNNDAKDVRRRKRRALEAGGVSGGGPHEMVCVFARRGVCAFDSATPWNFPGDRRGADGMLDRIPPG